MDDGGKQVSWPVAEVLASPSRLVQPMDLPVVFDARRTTYSCGGSPGFTPEFPLNPLAGNLSRAARMRSGPAAVKSERDPP